MTAPQPSQILKNLLSMDQNFIKPRGRFRTWHGGDNFEQAAESLIQSSIGQREAEVAVLRTYVPNIVSAIVPSLESKGLPVTRPYLGVCAFADVSGFSVLCETLHRHGTNMADVTSSTALEGAEFARDLLNNYFGAVMLRFRKSGGDVVKVAGDAIVVVWTCDKYEDLRALSEYGTSACCEIVKEFFETEIYGFKLSLHVGVGSGGFNIHLVGGKGDRWFHVCEGDAVDQSVEAMSCTTAGEVAVSETVWEWISGSGFRSVITEKGRIIKKSTEVIGNSTKLRHVHVPTLSEMAPITPEVEGRWLRSFANPAVLYHLHTSIDGNVSDLRLVTILFLRLDTRSSTSEYFLNLLQKTISEIQLVILRYAGNIKEFGLDDKGLVLVVGFGVPPQAHSNDPVRACEASLELRSRLRFIGLNPAIGITTGEVFCGAIGCEYRREYALVGTVVNRSARLMMLAQKRGADIIIDSATHSAAGNGFSLEQWTPVRLKGMHEPCTVYRLVNRKEDEEILKLPVLVGRELEVQQLRSLLEEHFTSHDGSFVSIEGEIGSGKSAMLTAAAYFATAQVGITCWIKGSGSQSWAHVLYQMLGLKVDPISGYDETAEATVIHVVQRTFWSHSAEDTQLRGLCCMLMDQDSGELMEKADYVADSIMRIAKALCERGFFTGKLRESSPMLLLVDDAHLLTSGMWYVINALLSKQCKIVVAIEPNLVTNQVQGQQDRFQSAQFESEYMLPTSTAQWVYRRMRAKAEKIYRSPGKNVLERSFAVKSSGSLDSSDTCPTAQLVVMKLSGLAISDAKRLIARTQNADDCDDSVAKFLVERTQGTPQFVIEWLSALDASGCITVVRGHLQSPREPHYTSELIISPPASSSQSSLSGSAHAIRIVSFVPGANYGIFPRAPHAITAMINSWIDALSPTMSLMLKLASILGRVISLNSLHYLCASEIESWKKLSKNEARNRLLKNLKALCRIDILRELAPSVTDGPCYQFKWLLLQDALYSHVSFEERQWAHWVLADRYWGCLMARVTCPSEDPMALFHAIAMLFEQENQEDIENFAQHINHAVLAQEHMHAVNMISIAPAGVIDAYLIDQTCNAFDLSPSDVDGIRAHLPLVPWLKGLYSMAQSGHRRAMFPSTRLLPRTYFQVRAEEARKRHNSMTHKDRPTLQVDVNEDVLPVWTAFKTPKLSSAGSTPSMWFNSPTFNGHYSEFPDEKKPSPPLQADSSFHFPSPSASTAKIFFDFVDGVNVNAPNALSLRTTDTDNQSSSSDEDSEEENNEELEPTTTFVRESDWDADEMEQIVQLVQSSKMEMVKDDENRRRDEESITLNASSYNDGTSLTCPSDQAIEIDFTTD